MSDLDPKQALAHIKTILTQGASGTQQAFGGVGPKAVAHATFSGTPILTNTAGLIGAGGVGA